MTEMMTYQLVIGSKNVSSWSLRPWLALVEAGIPFREIEIALRRPQTKAEILRYAPSGHVPALIVEKDGAQQVIWDSLAILEYLAEAHPDTAVWPRQPAARAHARRRHCRGDARGFPRAARALPDGFIGPHAARSPARRRRRRRSAHHRLVAGLPPPLWRQRPISVRRIFGGGCHVRAGRQPLSHLPARPWALG